MNPLQDPVEFGRRIAACRGYADILRPEFGERVGVDVAQVRRWEAGRELGDSIEERRELAEAIAEATDAPRSFLGLPDADADLARRVEALEAQVAELRALGGGAG